MACYEWDERILWHFLFIGVWYVNNSKLIVLRLTCRHSSERIKLNGFMAVSMAVKRFYLIHSLTHELIHLLAGSVTETRLCSQSFFFLKSYMFALQITYNKNDLNHDLMISVWFLYILYIFLFHSAFEFWTLIGQKGSINFL